MKLVLRLCFVAAMAIAPGLAGMCSAATLYTFDYTGPGSQSSDVLPFSFEFTTPADLQVGDPFTFAAFVVSDTLGRSFTSGHCFTFATAGYGSLPGDCNPADPTAVGDAVMTWSSSLGQPANFASAYYYMQIAYVVQSICGTCIRYGDGDANVIHNPEPATITMMLGGGALLFGWRRRQLLAGRR
jgi:PEP-CTERM motif